MVATSCADPSAHATLDDSLMPSASAEIRVAAPSTSPNLSRQALAAQLRTWESIVSRSPDAVCITDHRGVVEYINHAFECLFGHPSENILGRGLDLIDLAQPDGDSGALPGEHCVLPGFDHRLGMRHHGIKGHWQGEVLARRSDGQAVPVRVSTLPRNVARNVAANAESRCSLGHVFHFVDITDAKRRERQLETLRALAEDLSSQLELGDMVAHGLDAVVNLTETDFAALAFPSDDGSQLRYHWTTPLPKAELRTAINATFDAATSIAGAALRAGHETSVTDCRALSTLSDPLRALGARSALAYPVTIQGRAQAVLCVASLEQPFELTPELVQLLATVARQIGVAIDRDRLIDEARASSRQIDEIIQRNPDAILITDDDGRVRFANAAAQRLLARDADELADFPLGLTSQRNCGELDVHRANGDLVPVELHAMETTWEGRRAHVLTLRDLTDRRRAEQEKRTSADRIRTALVQTIEAISRTVETRDPYTAGHQRRVAVLGREMALAMGLEQELVDGVYMGGTIHDIGKLYIPSEILNRPGKLNDVELMLIKTHCSVGRDIIAGIDFPWPLAEMVHQHHERIDGGGYPCGLRGEAILVQSRILAVADVVDAMSSRRPYREALGLGAALDEIARGSGTRYDPAAAAVCIRLFTHQGLRLEDLEADG